MAVRHDKACAILPRREWTPGLGMNLFGRELSPGAVDEALDRLKMRLVGHLAAVLDPITEIQIRQGGAAALFDLPQDGVGAETPPGGLGVVKSVGRGKPLAELLDGDAHRNAGAAVIAVGPVGEDAAAAKPEPHEVRVELGADQVAGSRDL